MYALITYRMSNLLNGVRSAIAEYGYRDNICRLSSASTLGLFSLNYHYTAVHLV